MRALFPLDALRRARAHGRVLLVHVYGSRRGACRMRTRPRMRYGLLGCKVSSSVRSCARCDCSCAIRVARHERARSGRGQLGLAPDGLRAGRDRARARWCVLCGWGIISKLRHRVTGFSDHSRGSAKADVDTRRTLGAAAPLPRATMACKSPLWTGDSVPVHSPNHAR